MLFKRWTNKPFAVFNSLKRTIKIAVLGLTYSLLSLAASTSFAQSDSLRIDKKLELDEIEIISATEPLIFSQQARLVTLITKQDILRSSQSEIAGLLCFQKAIDIRSRGGFGVQSDISIRGSSFDQVLVLLNGFPISNAQTGHFSLNIPMISSAIERIEVLEGSAARIYGTNAYAGAVNIVTHPSNDKKVQLTAQVGENNYFNLGAFVNIATKKNKTFLSFQKSASDGYMENTDFRIKNFYLQSLWLERNYQLDLQLGFQQKDFGANGFYSAKYPLQYEYNTAYNGNFSLLTGKRFVSRFGFFWNRHQDQWVLNRENPAFYQNFHQLEMVGFKSNHRFSNAWGKTQIGVELKTEAIWSTKLGETQVEPKPVPWNAEYSFNYFAKRENASIFIDQQISLLPKFYTAFGFLANWNLDSKFYFFPGIDLSYELTKKWKFFSSLNQGMRLPTFTDLYYSDPSNIGNPALLAEKATSFEIGFKMNHQQLFIDVAYFLRNGKNSIDWVWLEAIEKWQTQNILEQNSQGIETSIKWSNPFEKRLLRELSVNYSFIDVRLKEAPQLAKYASTHLKHQLNLSAFFQLSSHLESKMELSYRDRVGVFQSYDFETLQYQEIAYKEVFLLNAKLSYSQSLFTVFVDGMNLLNSHYFENGVMQAGRWVKGGLIFNLNLTN